MRGAVLALLLIFWSLAVWNLDRFPTIHYDEAAIVAPGYQLFTQGVYGSPLFTGFHGQERLFLEITPLMPILQGAASQLFGVGLWQMRFVTVASGLLTLALAYALNCKLTRSSLGLIAMLLLIFWQWTPGGETFFGSGIPLLDIARVGRYDILVPLFGLSAFRAWLQAQQTGEARYDFLSGLLAGLASLANLYGLLWVGVLLLFLACDRFYFSRRSIGRRATFIILGVTLVWLGWIIIIVLNWQDLQGQFKKHSGRLDFLTLSFYLDSVLNEIHRYRLHMLEPRTFIRAGFWLLVLGMPLAIWGSIRRVARRGDQEALWLLVSALAFPVMFALFINTKRYYYLITVVPFFAMLLAWEGTRLFRGQKRAGRLAILALAGLLLLQGTIGIAKMQMTAGQVVPPRQFFQELSAIVSPSGRIMGPPEYWLGMPERDYRSIALPFLISNPRGEADPLPFDTTLATIAPAIILMHPSLPYGLASTDRYYGLNGLRTRQFWAFMRQHRARVIGELVDYNGDPVQVYLLDW